MKRILLILVVVLMWGQIAVADDYVIGAGDSLDISVWGVETLSVAVIVRPDGKITLPATGDIAAEGRTPSQLSKELKSVLSKFVKSPIVTVTVSNITNNRVYVTGGGVASQVIPLPKRTTLFKLLTTIGGIENTDLRKAYLLRDKEVIKKDFYDLFRNGDFTQDVSVQAEDILFIPSNEQNKIYITGAVNTPQYLVYREGMRVLDAILESGGLTEYAKGNRVIVRRKDGARVKVRLEDLMEGQDSAQNIPLRSGDQVIVFEGIF